jgi:hypothetical protein
MSTRCKPGDLAIIMYDVPQCMTNIGRVVEISGPAEYDRHGRLTWLIQPVTADPYLIHNSQDDSVTVMGYPEPGIEHPDEWMQPVQHRSAPGRAEDSRTLRPGIH